MSSKPSPGWLIVEWVARLPVCLLFLYTGWTKVRGLGDFVKEVQAYQLIPHVWDQWSYPLAYVLPWLELLTAALLLVGFWRCEARLLLAAMLVGFTAGKTYVLAIGRNIECGCVPADSVIHFLFDGWVGVATNVGLLLFLGIEAFAERRRRRGRSPSRSAEQANADPAQQPATRP